MKTPNIVALTLAAALVGAQAGGQTRTNSAALNFAMGAGGHHSSLGWPKDSTVLNFAIGSGGLYNENEPPLDKTNRDGRLGFSWFEGGHPEITIITGRTVPCPLQLRFDVSNSNLFKPDERAFLQTIWTKYRIPGKGCADNFRTDSGDGYDVSYMPGATWVIHKVDPSYRIGDDYNAKQILITNHSDWRLDVEQVKHWQLNGLKLEFYGDHGGGSLLHFTNDEATGDWFDWAPDGNLRFHGRFDKPYHLFEHLIIIKCSAATN